MLLITRTESFAWGAGTLICRHLLRIGLMTFEYDSQHKITLMLAAYFSIVRLKAA